MPEQISAKQYWFGVIGLGLLALLGNWLSLSLFFGLDLIFGSVAVMLAAAWLGVWAAGLVALAGAFYTIVLWGQPFAIPAFVLEGLLVAWLHRRRHWKNLVLADLLFWVVVGVPVVLFMYKVFVEMANSAIVLIALKQAINGVINALLAGLILLGIAYRQQRNSSLSLNWIVFHCLMTGIMLAVLAPILIDARSQRSIQEQGVLDRFDNIVQSFAARLAADPLDKEQLESILGQMQILYADVTLAVQTDQETMLAPGRQLQTLTPSSSLTQATAHERLNIWLPTGEYSAVARWRAGYYWLRVPLDGLSQGYITIEYPASRIVQFMESQRLARLLLMAGILLLTVLLAEAMSRLLINPIARLAKAGQHIENGVLTGRFTPLPGHLAKEFDQLSLSLNHMGSELASSVQVLRNSRGELAESVAFRTKELADSNGLLLSVLDAAEDFSIIATDHEGLITLFNAGAQKMLGYSATDLVGKMSPAVLHDPQEVQTLGDELSSKFSQPISGFRVFVFEAELGIRQPRQWTYITRSGLRVPVSLVVTVIRGSDGNITGYLGIAEDISERKRLEQIKNEFISTVSHELRTPLTSISGALGLLKAGTMGKLSEQAADMVTLAHNNSQRLAGLINDLLDIEKIAAGKLHFDYQWLVVSDQLTLALTTIDKYSHDQKVVLDLISGGPDGEIHADPQRLQQVLSNLLSNAVKFSPPNGLVSIDASVNKDRIRINVRDKGDGISDEFKERIFQRFAQADSSDQRRKGGTGLGLAISKELVEQMGGNIGFDSRPGQGAVFWIEFPCRLANPLLHQPRSVAVNGAQLLVIEDDEYTARMLALLLENGGYQVSVAGTAQHALSLCSQQTFDAITLDLGLPDMDGLDLLCALRELPGVQTAPVVVISGRVHVGDLELLEYQPGIEIIPKPVDSYRLLRIIRQHLICAPATGRILHVEDNYDLHSVIRDMAGTAFHFQLATNLAEGRALLQNQVFDLVLLDLGLPDGLGAELIEDIRQLLPRCGIVLLTGQSVGPELRSQVDAALVKSSISVPELLSRIGKLIKSNG